MIIKSPPRLTNRQTYIKYLEVDLWSWLKELAVAFLKMNFTDNFQSFTAEDVSILAGQEISIPNQFRNKYPGLIPSGRIIVRQKGNANIIDGDADWTEDLVFLKNPSANNAIISVVFFK